MFKNLILCRLGENGPGASWLEEALTGQRFAECQPTQERSMGWVAPRSENGAMVEAVAGQWIMRFKSEMRVLPADVVRRKTEERLAKIEQITGRKPGKKQAREIREDTFIQLLPQAFTRQESALVWMDPDARILAIDVGSQKKAEDVLLCLFKCVPGLTATPLTTASSPAASMGLWLAGRASPGSFDIDRECELKSTDDTQATVKYARHHLDIAEIRQHVAGGKVPTRLAMAYEGRISFVLTDQLHLKKIKFLEGVFDSDLEDEDRFDADTVIATGEMGKVIRELVEALGGEAA